MIGSFFEVQKISDPDDFPSVEKMRPGVLYVLEQSNIKMKKPKTVEIGQRWKQPGASITIEIIGKTAGLPLCWTANMVHVIGLWPVIVIESELLNDDKWEFLGNGNQQSESKYGAVCVTCKEDFPHAEYAENFKCYKCKNGY